MVGIMAVETKWQGCNTIYRKCNIYCSPVAMSCDTVSKKIIYIAEPLLRWK